MDSFENEWILFARRFLIELNRVNLHSPSPTNSVGLVAYFHKVSIKLGQSLGLHIFRNLTEEKVNMATVSMSKSEPTICVNI